MKDVNKCVSSWALCEKDRNVARNSLREKDEPRELRHHMGEARRIPNTDKLTHLNGTVITQEHFIVVR